MITAPPHTYLPGTSSLGSLAPALQLSSSPANSFFHITVNTGTYNCTTHTCTHTQHFFVTVWLKDIGNTISRENPTIEKLASTQTLAMMKVVNSIA